MDNLSRFTRIPGDPNLHLIRTLIELGAWPMREVAEASQRQREVLLLEALSARCAIEELIDVLMLD